MRILLLNQAFVGPEEPGHTRHYEMAQFLRERGHELVIVASKLNYQTGQHTVKQRGLAVEQNIDGVRVLRAAILPALHRSYLWRIVSFFSFMLSSIWASLRVKDVDLVMGTTPPIFQALSAFLVAFLRRKPFLLEVRDLWPEFIVAMGVFTNPVLIQLARWLESFLYARAAHILVNSPAYVTYLIAKGVPAGKITFIPYGTDVDMFSPEVDGSAVRAEWGLDNTFTVLYAGALGQANDIYTLLRAAARLKNTRISASFSSATAKNAPRCKLKPCASGWTMSFLPGRGPRKICPPSSPPPTPVWPFCRISPPSAPPTPTKFSTTWPPANPPCWPSTA